MNYLAAGASFRPALASCAHFLRAHAATLARRPERHIENVCRIVLDVAPAGARNGFGDMFAVNNMSAKRKEDGS